MDKESIHEIRDVMLSVLDEFFKKLNRDKTYTVNQIAKRLGVSHATITKRIREGLIQTTTDGRIAEEEVENYLRKGIKNGRQIAI
jgi:excisionase family DNA binding protein